MVNGRTQTDDKEGSENRALDRSGRKMTVIKRKFITQNQTHSARRRCLFVALIPYVTDRTLKASRRVVSFSLAAMGKGQITTNLEPSVGSMSTNGGGGD